MRKLGPLFLGSLLTLIAGIALAATIPATTTKAAVTPAATVKAAATTPTISPAQAAVSWTAVTTNVDGSAVTPPITYNLYQGLTGALTKVQSGLTVLSVVVTTGLTPGTTQCWAVTAVESGVESVQSNQACGAIPLATPGSPSQVTVVITGS